MRLLDLMLFIAFFNIFLGIYHFYFLYVTKKLFDIKVKEEGYDKTWFMFCCDRFDNALWKLRQKFKFRWFYESSLFIIFLRLKGIFSCLVGIAILILIFFLKKTEWWILITEKL